MCLKKEKIIFLTVTGAFLCVLLGIFIGRNCLPNYYMNHYISQQDFQEASASETDLGKININTANWDQLMQLPGIGETIAQRIIDYREQSGLFTTIEDLENINGIGPGTLDKIRPFITLGG